jgi:hypothetical protein
MTLELVSDEDIRYNKRKSEIKCRICKGNDTRTASDGEPIWIRDKNIRGDWTGQFLCYNCYYKKDKSCYECGSEQITESVRMFRHYNKDIWTGKYICQDCYGRNNIDYKNKNIILKIGKGVESSLLDIVVSKVLRVPTYSIYIADKRLPFGIIHEDYGIIGIKASKLRYNYWYFNINDYISADTYFLIGLDNNLRNISSIHIIPTEERKNGRSKFTIYENSKKYHDLKIDHKPYNNIYKNMIGRLTESYKT